MDKPIGPKTPITFYVGMGLYERKETLAAEDWIGSEVDFADQNAVQEALGEAYSDWLPNHIDSSWWPE